MIKLSLFKILSIIMLLLMNVSLSYSHSYSISSQNSSDFNRVLVLHQFEYSTFDVHTMMGGIMSDNNHNHNHGHNYVLKIYNHTLNINYDNFELIKNAEYADECVFINKLAPDIIIVIGDYISNTFIAQYRSNIHCDNIITITVDPISIDDTYNQVMLYYDLQLVTDYLSEYYCYDVSHIIFITDKSTQAFEYMKILTHSLPDPILSKIQIRSFVYLTDLISYLDSNDKFAYGNNKHTYQYIYIPLLFNLYESRNSKYKDVEFTDIHSILSLHNYIYPSIGCDQCWCYGLCCSTMSASLNTYMYGQFISKLIRLSFSHRLGDITVQTPVPELYINTFLLDHLITSKPCDTEVTN